jgi:hypothetical protein
MLALAFLFFLETAVIVAFPTFLAVMTPLLFTVATLLLLDFHLTALDAFLGLTDFTFALNVSPTCRVLLFAFKVIFVGFLADAANDWFIGTTE